MTRRAYILASRIRSENRALCTAPRSHRPLVDSRGPWTLVYDRLVLARSMRRCLISALLVSVVACGGSSSSSGGPPVNAAGNYTGTVTNQMSSCPGLWNQGDMTDVQITATQTDTGNITLQINGALGLFVQLGFGTRIITGTVSGSHIEAVLVGMTTVTENGCTHGWQGNLSADVSGNTITGSMVYTPQNMTGACTMFMGCMRQ